MNASSLSAMTGLPSHASHAKHGKPKRRRPKKPGSHHLAQLTQAHGTGDHHAARTHALNYAKEITKHLAGRASTSPVGADEEVTDETPRTNTAPAAPSTTAGVSRLAALMRSRK